MKKNEELILKALKILLDRDEGGRLGDSLSRCLSQEDYFLKSMI